MKQKHNPFHVGVAELFHDDAKAKLVIEILNKIGLCISYDEFQRIDFGLVKRVINVTRTNREPVSLSINKKTLIHGVTQFSCCFKIRTKMKTPQKLLVGNLGKLGKFGGRGKIPGTFLPGDEINLS